MNFSWLLDGGIIGFYILISLLVGLSLRKYVSNVEDYLVAGREVNLYAGMASLAATEFGIVTCMAAAQLGYRYGFSGAMVGLLLCTSMYLVGKTGFCIKPLRDANAMTLPEFFEKKYSPRVRWATGVIIVIGGLLNTGIFENRWRFLSGSCWIKSRLLRDNYDNFTYNSSTLYSVRWNDFSIGYRFFTIYFNECWNDNCNNLYCLYYWLGKYFKCSSRYLWSSRF